MILTGSEIAKEVYKGNIFISNFIRERVNPNSYNLTLNEELMVYSLDEYYEENMCSKLAYLDSKKDNKVDVLIIPEDGLILYPGVLYLGHTNEVTYTNKYVPMLDGRSSIGRLGMNVHITAGFGDIGFRGTWTLEISVTHPLKIYPNMEICQISFQTPQGNIDRLYNGKYMNQQDTTPSKLYTEYNNK